MLALGPVEDQSAGLLQLGILARHDTLIRVVPGFPVETQTVAKESMLHRRKRPRACCSSSQGARMLLEGGAEVDARAYKKLFGMVRPPAHFTSCERYY